jgi:hypothetical protein
LTVKSHLPSLICASSEAGSAGDGDGRFLDPGERYYYLLESLISSAAWFGRIFLACKIPPSKHGQGDSFIRYRHVAIRISAVRHSDASEI